MSQDLNEVMSVDCPHTGECSDYPNKCQRCKKNKKISYFEPEQQPYSASDFISANHIRDDPFNFNY